MMLATRFATPSFVFVGPMARIAMLVPCQR
jgi:hypothetical protein